MIRISKIEIDNFKSLVDFEMELPKFTCLIGLNGSGKSTVLQALDFVSQLAIGDMGGWLRERRWISNELKSKLSPKKFIEFAIQFSDNNNEIVGEWSGTYNPAKSRCTKERFESPTEWIHVSKDTLEIGRAGSDDKPSAIAFDYQGSIVSQLKEELVPISIRGTLKLIKSLQSLDLLSPEWLRQRTRESSGTLGLGGQNLASFIHEMDDARKKRLYDKLILVYPNLSAFNVRPRQSGWKQLEIRENYIFGDQALGLTTEARHMNDGMLRLIAILAELESDHGFLLFDEIENGINPELVEFLLDNVVSSQKQVLVTTHSPMILNYLPDDVAKKGVVYLYKDQLGHTRSIPFFSIPSLAEKLTVMGPGEAFVDTNLTELIREIEQLGVEQ